MTPQVRAEVDLDAVLSAGWVAAGRPEVPSKRSACVPCRRLARLGGRQRSSRLEPEVDVDRPALVLAYYANTAGRITPMTRG